MDSYNDIMWNSQILLTQYDKSYGTDGYLRISITNNTKDYMQFSQVFFSFSISGQLTKSVNLSIQNATDLLQSQAYVIANIQKIYQENDYQILKRYNKKSELLFDFFKNQKEEKLIKISIISNETDKASIIIDANTFIIICKRLKYFVNNYDEVCLGFPNSLIQKELLSTNKKLYESFKRFPSEIRLIEDEHLNQDRSDESNFDVKSITQETNDNNINESINNIPLNTTIDDLDKFLGEDLSNINIPEIDPIPKIDIETNEVIKKEKVQEYDSIFFKGFDYKLKEIENFLTFSQSTDNPLAYIIDNLEKNKFKEDINIFQNIEDNDWKSLCYLSYLNTSLNMKNAIEYNKPLPVGFPLLKCKLKKEDITDDHISISYDMLLYNIYLKKMRSNIESKVDDIISNKSLIYLLVRYYFDPMIYSFLENIEDPNIIRNNIISRFKYYKSIGMFDEYEKDLEFNNCEKVTERDLTIILDEIIEKVLYNHPHVDVKHKGWFEGNIVNLDYDNNLDLENIVTKVVPIESFLQTGFELTKIPMFVECEDSNIKKLFLDPKKSAINKIKKEKKDNNNLIRLINQYRNEIPDNVKDVVMEYVDNIEDNDVNLKEVGFPIETLGDNIIKILYLWKPSEDEKLKTQYKYFFEQFENMMMTKDLILTKINFSKDTVEDSSTDEMGDWGDFL